MNMFELGQLFMTGVSGLTLTEAEKDYLCKSNIGGVILFKYNYEHPAQLAELINEIQTLRDEYPLFISVDQEGGRVMRFKTHFTQFPTMYDVGQTNSPKLTFDIHKALGEELSSCGVNLDFSPCCDIWTNPNNKVIGDRAFGKTVESVEKNISAAIRGLHTSNVLACAKHFPGHGDTTKDSHYDLPYVGKSLEELRKSEIVPFVKASKSRVEFIMMAHLVVDAIDKEFPLTLTPKSYAFLRSELKYKKLIITDDMEMKAITEHYSYGEASKMAIESGVDIVLHRSMESSQEAFEYVKQQVTDSKLSRSKISEKIKRVIECKKQFLSNYKPIYIPSLSKMFKEDRHKDLLEQISSSKK